MLKYQPQYFGHWKQIICFERKEFIIFHQQCILGYFAIKKKHARERGRGKRALLNKVSRKSLVMPQRPSQPSLLYGQLGNDVIQFSSVAQSCPTLCDPMNCSTPGLPIHHQLPEFTQTHVHRVSDAIQPSHPLSSPSPPAPNPSQHQGLFQ